MKKFSLFIFALALVAFAAHKTFAQNDSLIFTTSGTFTIPAGITSVTIELVGAGGSGWLNGGGGGGGGGYAKGTYTVAPLTTLNITIGAGGGGSAAGTTNVDALISATGGENGFTVPNPNIGGGGAGGTGTGGTIANRVGGTGGGGYWTYFGGGGAGAAGSLSNGSNGGNTIPWTGQCLTPGGAGGPGGGAPGGNGGKGAGFTDINCNVTNPAVIGGNWGGGGGGGNGNGGAPAFGAGGYCKISWQAATSYSLTGTIKYPNAAQTPLAGIGISLKNASGTVIATTNTNGSGAYEFNGLADGNYSLEAATSKEWGGVTAIDVLLYKKHIANIAFLSGIFLASGDVNDSGGLTATDVLLIKKRIAGITSSFTVGDWLFNNNPVTISGSNVVVDFYGLCYGDANGSYTNP
ncbi:MAG: SdrD B-like domain-containing protein [Bacteroidota bacterium]